jgi:hypothetical protein
VTSPKNATHPEPVPRLTGTEPPAPAGESLKVTSLAAGDSGDHVTLADPLAWDVPSTWQV